MLPLLMPLLGDLPLQGDPSVTFSVLLFLLRMMATAADNREVDRDPDADLDSSNSYSAQEGINSQGNIIALCNTDRKSDV